MSKMQNKQILKEQGPFERTDKGQEMNTDLPQQNFSDSDYEEAIQQKSSPMNEEKEHKNQEQKIPQPPFINTNIGPTIQMTCKSWVKDSYSLFKIKQGKYISHPVLSIPIEASNVSLYRHRTSISSLISDNQLFVVYNLEGPLDKEKYQFLSDFKIYFDNNKNKHVISFIQSSQLQEKPYLIVKKNMFSSINCKLSPGQFLKMGKNQYFVKEISYNQVVSRSNDYRTRPIKKINPHLEQTPSNCRQCLQHKFPPKGFLITSCLCKGQAGTIHIQCLKKWIQSKVQTSQTQKVTDYKYKEIKCEICHALIPLQIQTVNGQIIDMLQIQKPKGPYIILELVKSKNRRILVINMGLQQNKVTYGRHHNSNIKDDDISTSRNHCVIIEQNDGFYIFDDNSQFGTLLRHHKMEFQLQLPPIWIQIGRTFIEITFEQTSQN